MTPGARHQKAIELLTGFWAANMPLDRFIKKHFRDARYMGSGDRRAVFQLIYELIRQRQSLIESQASTSRQEVLLFLLSTGVSLKDIIDLWNGSAFHPAPLSSLEMALAQKFLGKNALSPHAVANVPSWIYEELSLSFDAWMSLNQPAQVDLWVNPLKTSPQAFARQLLKNNYVFHTLPHSPFALRGEKALQLEKTAWYQNGFFEFQDAGSQALCQALSLPKEGRILDLCAGAGGKTLTLAARAPARLKLIATDKDESRLKRAQYRLERTHLAKRVDLIPFDSWSKAGPYDGILIDAPCSGSGVWRRHPETKWQLTPDKLKAFTMIQTDLLRKAFSYLKPGGWVAYATCSLFYQENHQIIEYFLKAYPYISEIKQQQWLPWLHHTDGFFLSILSH